MSTNNFIQKLSVVIVFCSCLISTSLAQNVVRTWTDKTGTFKVEAELLKYQDGKVYLLKKDGQSITVPATSLSPIDQGFLEGLSATKPANPFEPGGNPPMGVPAGGGDLSLLTQGNTQQLKTNGKSINIKGGVNLPPLEPDVFEPPVLRPFNVHLGEVEFFAKVSRPILVDPNESLYAMSVHQHKFGSHKEFGKVFLIKGRGSSKQEVIDLKTVIKILDHDVASGRSLLLADFESSWSKGGDLVLVDQLATGKPRTLKRWELPDSERGEKGAIKYARLINANTALIQIEKNVGVWNLDSGSCNWYVNDIGIFGKIRLSPTKKYLAFCVSGGCKIVDIASRNILGGIPFVEHKTPQVAFTNSGDRLAMIDQNRYVVWSLAEGRKLSDVTLSDSLGDLIGWVNEKYILTTSGGLVEPNLEMAVWKYSVPKGSILMEGGVVVSNAKHKDYSLVGLRVPHSSALDMEDRLTGGDDSLMAVMPGANVSIRIEAVGGIDKDVIYQGLINAVEKIGWVVDQNAPLQIVATIGRGKRQERTYRSFFGGGEETASITPFTASFQVVSPEGVELWKRSGTNGLPHMLHMGKDESIADAVRKYEKPDLKFFERLVIPPKILKPEVKKSIKTSTVSNGDWSY